MTLVDKGLIAVHHGSWPKHTVWLARRKAKVVFAEHEKVKSISYQCNPNKFEAHLQDKGGVEVIMKVQDIQKSQKMPPKLPCYGCSKCRYSRKGCISYQCNPNKFEAHLLAHPEMYFNRKVRATA